MSLELTDTNGQFNDDIPNGTYTFRVFKCVGKNIKDKKGYEWTLDYVNADGDPAQGKVLTWPNQIGELLRVLGCKETKAGVFEWQTDLMEGQTFKATITHDPNKKDPSKIYMNMKDFQKAEESADAPF